MIVASDIPAAREAIVDGETGVLFRKGDIVQLAAETNRVAGDPALRHAIGLQARRMAESRDLDSAVTQYEAALMELADGIPLRSSGAGILGHHGRTRELQASRRNRRAEYW